MKPSIFNTDRRITLGIWSLGRGLDRILDTEKTVAELDAWLAEALRQR